MVRDIAGAIQRHEGYNFDKMIYVIGDQQVRLTILTIIDLP